MLKEKGPRLEAISTLLAGVVVMTVRVGHSPGSPSAARDPYRPAAGIRDGRRHQLECLVQLHNAHPEGWRERPCEAPATTVVADAACWPSAGGADARSAGPGGRPPGTPDGGVRRRRG